VPIRAVYLADKKEVTPLYLAVLGPGLAYKENVPSIVDYLLTVVEDFAAENFDGRLLHAAVRKGSLASVKILVQAGAGVDTKGGGGPTSLATAASHNHTDVLRYLLEQGAPTDFKDEDGFTLLHLATWRSNLESIKLLVEAGVGLDITDKSGQTPLHMASRPSILQYLTKARAGLDVKDNNGITLWQQGSVIR
jgi:ankyrin repeat protein